MSKPYLNVSILALTSALVFGASFNGMAKEKAVIDLKPSSKWTATMIEGDVPENGYCALARKYDQGMILTLGQSARDEYSLAVDFQNEKLNLDKSYKINLQPGPGQIRAYEVMPASPQAMVVRLGYDESFIKSLEKSNSLKFEMDGKNYQFTMDDLTKGKTDLKNCMAGLKGEPIQTAGMDFSAEKIEDATPIKDKPKVVAEEAVKEIAKAPAAVPAPEKVKEEIKEVVADKASDKKDDKKPIQIARIDSQEMAVPKVEVRSAPAVKPAESAKAKIEPDAVMAPEPIIMTREPAKEEPQEIVQQIEEPKIAEGDIPKMEDQKLAQNTRVSVDPNLSNKSFLRPNSLASEDKNYGARVANSNPSKTAPPPPPMMKEAPKLVNAKPAVKEPEMPAVKAAAVEKPDDIKIAKMEDFDDFSDESKFPKPFSGTSSQPQSINVVKDETPRPPAVEMDSFGVVEPVEEVVDVVIPEPEKVAEVKTKIADDVKKQDEQLALSNERSAEAEKELKDVREKLAAMESQNRELYLEARKARGAVDSAVIETSNEALKKMREYEKKLEAAQNDNLALAKEIEEMRQVQENVQLSALSGDPAMQQSLQRYNEAQREIQRLGLLLEQQRVAHRQEKTELEQMLFDPAVTDEAQRRKLEELEKKLADAENKLKNESEKVNVVDVESQRKLQEMEAKLAESKLKEQQLKAEEEKIRVEAQRVAQAELKLAEAQRKEQELKLKEQKINEEKLKIADAQRKAQELQAKEQQLKLEANRVAQAEQKLAEIQRKEQELKVKQQNIYEQNAIVADAQRKAQELQAKEQQLKIKEQQLQVQAEQKLEQQMKIEAQKVAEAEAKLAQANQKEQELKETEAKINAEAQRITQQRLAEAERKEQELAKAEQALKSQEQTLAAVEARLAQADKKEAEIKLAQQRLAEQSRQAANYSNERVTTPAAPMAVVTPNQISPSAQNIVSNAPKLSSAPTLPKPVSASSFSLNNLQQLLNQSGLSSLSGLSQQSASRYSWSAEGMTGKAEIASGGQNLNQFAQSFIEREKQNCNGEFASLPAQVPNGKQGFEIACVGSSGGKSSSVVFAQKSGSLIAIIHETSAENMDAAMDARDKVAAQL